MDRSGAVVTAVFALAWAGSAATAIPGDAAAAGALVAALTITAVAIGTALARGARRGRGHAADLGLPVDWQRRFNVIGAVQGGSIAVVVLLATTAGFAGVVPAAVCFVVGLHFFPLAHALAMRYRPLGVALCLVGTVGVAFYSAYGTDGSLVVVGTGAALVLWSTSFRHTFAGLGGT